MIEYWEFRPEGRNVLSALIQCEIGAGLGGNVQGAGFSRASRSGAEVAVGGPGALPALLLCCRSMVVKAV